MMYSLSCGVWTGVGVQRGAADRVSGRLGRSSLADRQPVRRGGGRRRHLPRPVHSRCARLGITHCLVNWAGQFATILAATGTRMPYGIMESVHTVLSATRQRWHSRICKSSDEYFGLYSVEQFLPRRIGLLVDIEKQRIIYVRCCVFYCNFISISTFVCFLSIFRYRVRRENWQLCTYL